jgi:hypothetical protein
MPEGVTDRPAEIWEPLLAIADTAGGHWPITARNACRHFVFDTGAQITSFGVRLLADLHDLFTRAGTDRMRTTDSLPALTDLDESPWGDLNGRPLDARWLAKELSRYGVRPHDLRLTGGEVVKGYRTAAPDGLADAWDRYLPPPTTAATRATAATPQVSPVAATAPVADAAATPHPAATALTRHVAAVADVAAPDGLPRPSTEQED